MKPIHSKKQRHKQQYNNIKRQWNKVDTFVSDITQPGGVISFNKKYYCYFVLTNFHLKDLMIYVTAIRTWPRNNSIDFCIRDRAYDFTERQNYLGDNYRALYVSMPKNHDLSDFWSHFRKLNQGNYSSILCNI